MANGFLDGKGFFTGIAGNASERRFSVEGVIENLVPAAISVGVNNAGGVVAGLVYTYFDSKKAGWGALGVEFVSIAMKAAFQPTSTMNIILREAAAGMAGTVGKELSDEILLWAKAKDWNPMQAYRMGDVVKHSGAYWNSGTDQVPGSPSPGQSPNWTRMRAQGLAASQWPALAQGFLAQPSVAEGVAVSVAKAIQAKHGFNEAETAQLKADITQAMQTFAKVIYDAA